mgnify:CR=1 FL=1
MLETLKQRIQKLIALYETEKAERVKLRMELEKDSSVDIHIQFDSDGEWHQVETLVTTKKRSFQIPILPRRSDHFRLRFTGVGQWRLYSLVRESYTGSEYP